MSFLFNYTKTPLFFWEQQLVDGLPHCAHVPIENIIIVLELRLATNIIKAP